MLDMTNAVCITRQQEKDIRRYMPSNADVRVIADFFSVFSDATRVKILSVLSIGDMCVGDIAYIVNLNQSTVSHQLKLLRDAGIVDCRRSGRIIYYTLHNCVVEMVMNLGTDWAVNRFEGSAQYGRRA